MSTKIKTQTGWKTVATSNKMNYAAASKTAGQVIAGNQWTTVNSDTVKEDGDAIISFRVSFPNVNKTHYIMCRIGTTNYSYTFAVVTGYNVELNQTIVVPNIQKDTVIQLAVAEYTSGQTDTVTASRIDQIILR